MKATPTISHGWLLAPSACSRFCAAKFPWYGGRDIFHGLPLPPVFLLLYGTDNGLTAIVDVDMLHNNLLLTIISAVSFPAPEWWVRASSPLCSLRVPAASFLPWSIHFFHRTPAHGVDPHPPPVGCILLKTTPFHRAQVVQFQPVAMLAPTVAPTRQGGPGGRHYSTRFPAQQVDDFRLVLFQSWTPAVNRFLIAHHLE